MFTNKKINTVCLICLSSLMLTACGGSQTAPISDTSAATLTVAGTPATATTTATGFAGNIVLGAPTENSIAANIYAANQAGSVSISYGTSAGSYPQQSAFRALQKGTPMSIELTGLSSNTQYFYRLNYRKSDSATAVPSDEYSFHTARPAGSSFTFTIQGDSHPERPNEFNAGLYKRSLETAALDKPDFHLTLGDDFSVDTLDPATVTAAQVNERYAIQRPYLSLIGRSAPVFLVNGNHEQSAGYLLNTSGENVAVWAQNARNSYYAQPAPNSFYGGNTESLPFIGLPRNYYAWTWGDALFVTIDPYLPSTVALANVFGSTAAANTDIWAATHGDAQYQWLKTTLEQSTAKYKFVFAHHVMGAGRGGIEVANLAEWGGLNKNGVSEFAAKRPSWATPIHQLMVANKVSAFFQGHDHAWVHQTLDGVTYQTLSEPANPAYGFSEFASSYLSGDKYPNTGYTRVTVTPTATKVEYVRTYLPADEGVGKVSGSTAFTYTITPNASTTTNTNTNTNNASGTNSTNGVACAINTKVFNNSTKVMMDSTANWSCANTSRSFSGNGVPDHAVTTGNFATPISAQNLAFNLPLNPNLTSKTAINVIGYVLNGVKLDPGTAGSCSSTATSTAMGGGCVAIGGSGPWTLEAIGGSFQFGTDESNAHVQPNGQYHYHGMPEAYLGKLNKGKAMTLVGFAVDGFPIYARYGYSNANDASSTIKILSASYRKKTVVDTGRPSTAIFAMGTFTSDYEYVAGSGDLDECNGRTGVTPEFPKGIYHYLVTDSFPYIQRCIKGAR